MRTRFPLLRRALRIALPAILALPVLPAEADGGPGPLGTALLEVLHIPGGFNVCVEGDVSPTTTAFPGTWTLVIRGVRLDTAKVPTAIENPLAPVTAYSVDTCVPVYTNGYLYGHFEVEFAYAAYEFRQMPPVDGAPATAFTAQSFGGAVWSPSTGPRGWAVNPVSPSGPTTSVTP